jgi:vacuolar-type H+-ATPase subunit E/Vma4
VSVEAIVRVVAESAVAEADEIVERARTRAAEEVDAAGAAADARVREACAREEPGFQAAAMRRMNAARLRQLERRAARSAALVEAAANAAETLLREIARDPDGARWRAALDRLLHETADAIGAGGTLVVRLPDLAAARARGKALGCEVAVGEPAGEDDVLQAAGVIGRSADGRVEVDGTLAVRLARARVRLAEPVTNLLGVNE